MANIFVFKIFALPVKTLHFSLTTFTVIFWGFIVGGDVVDCSYWTSVQILSKVGETSRAERRSEQVDASLAICCLLGNVTSFQTILSAVILMMDWNKSALNLRLRKIRSLLKSRYKILKHIFIVQLFKISYWLRSRFYDILRCFLSVCLDRSDDLNCHNVIYESVMCFNVGGTCNYHTNDPYLMWKA